MMFDRRVREAGRAIVVGAGVAGLACAIALRRAGFEVAVFEQRADVARLHGGSGFHIWPRAARALAHLALFEAMRAKGAVLERTTFRSWTGARLSQWPVGEIARENGIVDIGVVRGDLEQTLFEALPAEVVTIGRRLTGYSLEGDRVRARFDDGPDESGDLLVGADGINSAVRRQLLGDRPARYDGYAQWQAVIGSLPEGASPGDEGIVWGRGLRFVYHPVGGGRFFWAAAVYAPPGSQERVEGRRSRLERTFAGWPSPVEAAIAATPEELIRGTDVYDRPPVDRWGDGPVTLAGDAAHPLTTNLGQGASQALEDAVMLAREVEAAGPGGLAAALRRYESARKPRTAGLQRLSHRLALAGAWSGDAACRLRDFGLGLMLGGPALNDHRADAAAVI